MAVSQESPLATEQFPVCILQLGDLPLYVSSFSRSLESPHLQGTEIVLRGFQHPDQASEF